MPIGVSFGPLYSAHPIIAVPCRAFGVPGQGSQTVGMGKFLYDLHSTSPTYRKNFDRAADRLLRDVNVDLRKLVFEGPIEALTRTPHAQPAIIAASVARFEHLRLEEGMVVTDNDIMMGHSVGEIAAYAMAGGLDIEEATIAGYWRGVFFEEAFPFQPGQAPMAAVLKLSKDVIKGLCAQISRADNFVAIANDNNPDEVVISGHPAAIVEVAPLMKSAGGRLVPLQTAGPFHTPLVGGAANRFDAKLDELNIHIRPLRNRVINNVTAKATTAATNHRQMLLQQIPGEVKWRESILMAWLLGAVEFVSMEVGAAAPGTILSKFTAKNFGPDIPMDLLDWGSAPQRQTLWSPAGMFRNTPYPVRTEVFQARVISGSFNVDEIVKMMTNLLSAGMETSEANLRLALRIVENEFLPSRNAGLRLLQNIAEHPLVAEAMTINGLSWPEPELPPVRDLPKRELDEAQIAELTSIYGLLKAKSIVPALDEFLYYVATRTHENDQKLADLIKKLAFIAKMDETKLAVLSYKRDGETLRGVSEWEPFLFYLDDFLKFLHPGAMNQEDCHE